MKQARLMGTVFTVVLLQANHAFAYIDPGTGSYLLQIIVAGVVGAAVAVRAYLAQIQGFFAKLFRGNKPE